MTTLTKEDIKGREKEIIDSLAKESFMNMVYLHENSPYSLIRLEDESWNLSCGKVSYILTGDAVQALVDSFTQDLKIK